MITRLYNRFAQLIMIVPGSEDYYYSYTTMIAEYNAMRDMQSYIGKLHSLQSGILMASSWLCLAS